MTTRKSTVIAIGGSDLNEATELRLLIKKNLEKRKCRSLVVMTVATAEPADAARLYTKLFREEGIKKVHAVDVSRREDGFNEESISLLKDSDAMFFTGGDQLNITSLMGGTPLHEELYRKWNAGTLIIGSSAGAAMMSESMIVKGKSDAAPRVEGITIAPGMGLLAGVLIDTHFSQRGRHGRLMTAVAHYPQMLGVGLDYDTAAVFVNGSFTVEGDGVVTVIDGSEMRHSDLPFKHSGETIGMFGVHIHVLPAGYSFDVRERKPIAPRMSKVANSDG